jgi:hypothetical protein
MRSKHIDVVVPLCPRASGARGEVSLRVHTGPSRHGGGEPDQGSAGLRVRLRPGAAWG